MTTELQREYAKQRAKGYPANIALSVAKMYTREYPWEQTARDYEQWTQEIDGFHVTLRARTESEYVKDNDGMGHYVETRDGYYVEHPRLAEDTPLNLPVAHFTYPSGSRDVYQAWFPDYVEDQYRWARTSGGMSRGVAREYITNWVNDLVRECCSSDYVYLDLDVTVSREGIELGRSSIGACDFINPRDADIFSMAEDYDLVTEALDEARKAIEQLWVSITALYEGTVDETTCISREES